MKTSPVTSGRAYWLGLTLQGAINATMAFAVLGGVLSLVSYLCR